MNRGKLVLIILAVALVIAGCGKKKTQAPALPPPPPPPAPTASISANPTTVQKGEATTLSWRTENATDVSIDGIGPVETNGSKSVTPTDSTTYRLLARGAGGTQDASTRVTVAPPPPVETTPAPTLSDQQLFEQNVKDIYFDYDSYDIRGDAQQLISSGAAFLNQHPNWRFTIEGHCDERGSTEYNLTLGDERANAVKQALVSAGVNAGRITVISYGKEKPFCTESTEACWQQNRRGHFVLGK